MQATVYALYLPKGLELLNTLEQEEKLTNWEVLVVSIALINLNSTANMHYVTLSHCKRPAFHKISQEPAEYGTSATVC